MNFYYDIIFGLQYTYIGETIMFDACSIPNSLSIPAFLKELKSNWGNDIISCPQIEVIGKITDYKL